MITETEINKLLSTSYTDKGIERWWVRTRHQLDHKTPKEVFLTDPQKILDLAKELIGAIND